MATILLIDDSEAMLEHVRSMLESAGHSVLSATAGWDGIKLLHTNPVEVVVTDLYMPPPDGFEIIGAARTFDRKLPIVVMSTNPLACDVFRAARALGAKAALQKPFSAAALLAAVDAALLPEPAESNRTNNSDHPRFLSKP